MPLKALARELLRLQSRGGSKQSGGSDDAVAAMASLHSLGPLAGPCAAQAPAHNQALPQPRGARKAS